MLTRKHGALVLIVESRLFNLHFDMVCKKATSSEEAPPTFLGCSNYRDVSSQ